MQDELSTLVAVIDSRLSSIEGKLDKVSDDHESRLRRLEAWSYALPVSVLTAICSLIVAFLG